MISAVVLAYNRCAEVLFTIDKLKEFAVTLPFAMEIIVVDNASVDDTTAQVKHQHPDITLVTKIKNNGIAGWNDGFAVARHKYLLVLDDDSHPEWGITEAVEYMESHTDVGILALNITSGPYLTDVWNWQNGKPWQDNEDVLGFFGCGAIIKKSVYEKIGGFAEWMLVYGHEWDFGIRCLDAGYQIKYFKNSSINHRASPLNRTKKRARIFGSRNDMGIVYKYFPKKRWHYIFTMAINNIKRIKSGDLACAYYDTLGFFEFLKIRKSLSCTPVSEKTQKFFTDRYMNTHPAFGFIGKGVKKLLGKR